MEILLLLYNLYILPSGQTRFLFFWATFVTKSNVLLFSERLLINSFKRRYGKLFVKSQATCAKLSNTKKNWTTSLHSITLKIMLNHVTICKLQISSSLRAIINRNDDPVLQDFSWGGRTLRELENLPTNSWSYSDDVFVFWCAKKRESRVEGEFQSKTTPIISWIMLHCVMHLFL